MNYLSPLASKDQSRQGGDRPIIANSKTAAVLESIASLFSGLTWRSSQKLGETHFLGQNWAQKPQICPKSVSGESLVVESCFIYQNDRQTGFALGFLGYVYPSDNRKCPKNTIF